MTRTNLTNWTSRKALDTPGYRCVWTISHRRIGSSPNWLLLEMAREANPKVNDIRQQFNLARRSVSYTWLPIENQVWQCIILHLTGVPLYPKVMGCRTENRDRILATRQLPSGTFQPRPLKTHFDCYCDQQGLEENIASYALKLQVNTSPDNSSNTSTTPYAPLTANQNTNDNLRPRRGWQQTQRNRPQR